MIDKELLELAAKACGVKITLSDDNTAWIEIPSHMGSDITQLVIWEPQYSDSDAFRLAINLSLEMYCGDDENSPMACVGYPEKNDGKIAYCIEPYSHHDGDACQAFRHAIIRAAAEIGKRMQ